MSPKMYSKKILKKKVTIAHLKYLNGLKEKLSKAKHLNCRELKQAEYIQNSTFTTREKRLLFKLRSKTLDVKQNFPGVHPVVSFQRIKATFYNVQHLLCTWTIFLEKLLP